MSLQLSFPDYGPWSGQPLLPRLSSERDQSGLARPRGDDRINAVNLTGELICLRGVLSEAVLQAAERRSRELNLGADQVLLQWGAIDEASYLGHLARHLGTCFDDLSDVGRSDCPVPDQMFVQVAQSGILPIQSDTGLIWVIAPRALAARHLMRFAANYPWLVGRIRLTTQRDLHRFLTEQTGNILADLAAESLHRACPELSARHDATPRQNRTPAWLCALGGLALVVAAPALAIDLVGGLAAIWFLTFSLLRLACVLVPEQRRMALPRLRDDQLPRYSIIVALYREARSVPGLLRALQRLDYPSEKLDIILVLELDDLQTRAALARARPPAHIRVLIAPAMGPTTKPKALNFALPFAQGSFIAVYDAEDDPDRDQLRAALDVFRRHDDDVACVQAALHFDNATHSLLSRMAAVEYAGLFSVFLPGLAAMGMPLPLGGTSNHFRADVLRAVGGWDPYNVTEDADLGMRLARLGYRSMTLDSLTLEEAPIAFGAWLRQRSRWNKGWMQTWRVHMRHPRQLWRQAGPRGFLTLNIIFGGNILTSLAFALLVGKALIYLASGDGAALFESRLASLHVLAIICGFGATCIVGWVGLARRGRLRDGWVLALTPIYWGCLSIASWRALWQLFTNPHHWEKTEHGLVHRTGTVTGSVTGSVVPAARIVPTILSIGQIRK